MKTFKSFVKSKLLSTSGNIVRNEDGNFAIIGAITIGVLVAGLSLAIDISNGWSAKQTLQDTTDAIALAAARSEIHNQTELNQIAQEYLDWKFPGESGALVNLESITRDGPAVTVLASNNQETFFAGIFGISGLGIKAASTAVYESRDLNLALVLDSTGSMRNATPTGGTRLDSLKSAGNDLIDLLGTSSGEVNVSVVPFALHVNVGTNLSRESWLEFPQTGSAPSNWDGCVGSRQAPLDTRIDSTVQRIPGVVGSRGCAITAVLPLTQNLTTVKNSINNIAAKGSTYIPAGIAWGWRTLTPTAPFTETRNQDSARTDNVMVVVTDGNNTRSKDGFTHELRNRNGADTTMVEMCENAKRDNIEIYTIALEIKDDKTLDLLQGCASGSGNFFSAANGDELGNAFNQIAISLSTSRITS